MKKSTKGALAAAAAGSLLIGGTGSLAFWTATQNVTGGTITSGNITLGSPTCTGTSTDGGSVALHDWQYDGGATYTMGTSKIVPGDTLSKVCEMTLTMTGDHIGATLGLASISYAAGGDSALQADLAGATATFKVDNATYAPITDPGTYKVVATVSIPFDSAATDAKNVSATLNALTLTATQTHEG